MNPIRALILMIVAVSMSQAQISQASEHSNDALELSLRHVKSDAALTVSLKNISSETLTVVTGNPRCDLDIAIVDSTGSPAKPTPLGKRSSKNDSERAQSLSISYHLHQLPPGKDMSVVLPIKSLFGLEPGREYVARVRWARGLPAKTLSGRPLRGELSRSLAFRH